MLAGADYEALAEFRHQLRRFLLFSETAAGAAGLTAQQHQALLAIKGHPGAARMMTRELAERLCIRHHSAVGLVTRLVAKRLVRRRIGAVDRRQVLIELTATAERKLAALSAIHRREITRLAPLLGELLGRIQDRP